MAVRYVLGGLLLLLLTISGVSAQVTVKTSDGAGADTYVYYGSNNTNYGAVTYLRMNKNYISYIKFDLSAAGSNELLNCDFTLYGTPIPGSPPGYDYEFPVYGLLDGSDDWGEMTITYNNAPLVSNPIVRHPQLVHLGWLDYVNGDESALVMRHAGGTPLTGFLNNRGPDNLVTLIIGSDTYTAGNFFSTKEDHGDASEAPYLTFEVDPTIVAYNSWTGATSNDWSIAGNWLNESGVADVPDTDSVVHITGGTNLPVVINADATAKKVFVHAGGLEVASGTLTISGGVLRVKDDVVLNIVDGEIQLAGNVEGYMWPQISADKITTSKGPVWEVYAQYDSDLNITVVKVRRLVHKLVWGSSIVAADGPIGNGGRPAEFCVDGRDMLGETHLGFIYGGGAPSYTSCNSYYGRDLEDLGFDYEPTLKFEFDSIYNLTDMYFWNYTLSYALKTIRMEYSVDDITYTTLMNGDDTTFTLLQGNKDGTKDGVISFGGAPAKYVKLTAVGGPGLGRGNYETGFYGRYILREVQFCHEGLHATEPQPAIGKEVDIFMQLQWLPGNGAVTGQDVWLYKTGQTPVKIASDIGPEVTSYIVGPLDNREDYTWRVDGLDGATTNTGTTWTFSTRARLPWNPGLIGIIAAEGSEGVNGTPGERAVNWSGITYDLHEAGAWSNEWYCRKPWDLDPPITEPQLVVTFDRVYDIDEAWIWNHDGSNSTEQAIAMKTIMIEYSSDGVNYTTLMNGAETTFILPQGNADGTHDTEIDFGGVSAKYVRITAVGGPGVGNYGSTEWGYKLREVRFYYEVPLWSDVNGSKNVDLLDYAIITDDWLVNNWVVDPGFCAGKPAGDVTGDCIVDDADVDVLISEWLESIP